MTAPRQRVGKTHWFRRTVQWDCAATYPHPVLQTVCGVVLIVRGDPDHGFRYYDRDGVNCFDYFVHGWDRRKLRMADGLNGPTCLTCRKVYERDHDR
jgi:hypothetical protein